MLVEMELSIEVARALTYRTSYVVDLLNNYTMIAEVKDVDKEQKRAAKKKSKQLKRIAAFLTPVCKYYATEMCNDVAYQAIQVLGGSGYMKDYPVERYARDARITNIYEGTTQLQVVAAIGGVLSGVAERYFAELAEGEMPEGFDDELKSLADARETLKNMVDFVKSKDKAYIDLMARRLVDIAIDIYAGYLLLDQARSCDRKKVVARRVIRRAEPRIELNARVISSGDDSTLSEFQTIAGEPIEVG